jgi:hypothetical protein
VQKDVTGRLERAVDTHGVCKAVGRTVQRIAESHRRSERGHLDLWRVTDVWLCSSVLARCSQGALWQALLATVANVMAMSWTQRLIVVLQGSTAKGCWCASVHALMLTRHALVLLQVGIESNALTLRVHHEGRKQDGEEGDEGDKQETGKDKKQTASDSDPTWLCAERLGVFSKRRVRLPKHADTSAARASYTDGVLTIQIPTKRLVDTSIKPTVN